MVRSNRHDDRSESRGGYLRAPHDPVEQVLIVLKEHLSVALPQFGLQRLETLLNKRRQQQIQLQKPSPTGPPRPVPLFPFIHNEYLISHTDRVV
jgi:hypothetical protein